MLTADQLAKIPAWISGMRQRIELLEIVQPDVLTALALAEDLLAALAELNNAITWHTACLNCSSLLDASYAETMRAEKAEKQLAEALAEAERLKVQASNYAYQRDEARRERDLACAALEKHRNRADVLHGVLREVQARLLAVSGVDDLRLFVRLAVEEDRNARNAAVAASARRAHPETPVEPFQAASPVPPDGPARCPRCGGLDGMHVRRNCVAEPSALPYTTREG